MDAPSVSVVIVSRGRPDALRLCLTGVAQLDHPVFEVIVVACPQGAAVVADRSDADRIKLVPFDEPNISAARNLGIAQAAGEVAVLGTVRTPVTVHRSTTLWTGKGVQRNSGLMNTEWRTRK